MSNLKKPVGKPPLDNLPLASLVGVSRVFEHGYHPDKYERGNWYTANDDESGNHYTGAFLRHLLRAQRPGGTFSLEALSARDAESGLPEIDHMLTGLMILRGLLTKRGFLPEDPGRSKLYASPSKVDGWASLAHDVVSDGLDPVTVDRRWLSKSLDRAFDQGITEGERRAADTRPTGPGDAPVYPPIADLVEKVANLDPECRAAISGCCDMRAETGACEHTTRAAEHVRRLGRQVICAMLASPDPVGQLFDHAARTRNAQPVDDEAARAAQSLVDGVTGRGPRFVVVKAQHVPEGAVAEFFSVDAARSWAETYNRGDVDSFNAKTYCQDRVGSHRLTHAVVDTRPMEGYGK